eukprot:gene9730-biopygen6218
MGSCNVRSPLKKSVHSDGHKNANGNLKKYYKNSEPGPAAASEDTRYEMSGLPEAIPPHMRYEIGGQQWYRVVDSGRQRRGVVDGSVERAFHG